MHSVGESFFSENETWRAKLHQIKTSVIPDQSNNLREIKAFASKQHHTLFVCFLALSLGALFCGLYLFYKPGFYDYRLTPTSWFGQSAQVEVVQVKKEILEEILQNKQLTLHEYNQLVHARDVDQLMKVSIVTGSYPRLQFLWSLFQLAVYFSVIFALVFKSVGSTRIFHVDNSEIFYRLYHCVEFRTYFLFAVIPVSYWLSGVFENFMTLSAPQQFLYRLLRVAMLVFTCYFKLFSVDFKQIPQIMSCTTDSSGHRPLLPFLSSSSVLDFTRKVYATLFFRLKRRDLLNGSNRAYIRWAIWLNVKFSALFLAVYRLLALVANVVIARDLFACRICHRLNGPFFDVHFFKEMFSVSMIALLLFDLALVLTRFILSRGSLHFLYKRKNFSFLLKLLWQISHSKTDSAGTSAVECNRRKPLPRVRVPGALGPRVRDRVRVRLQFQKRPALGARNDSELEVPVGLSPARLSLHRRRPRRAAQAVRLRQNGRKPPVGANPRNWRTFCCSFGRRPRTWWAGRSFARSS